MVKGDSTMRKIVCAMFLVAAVSSPAWADDAATPGPTVGSGGRSDQVMGSGGRVQGLDSQYLGSGGRADQIVGSGSSVTSGQIIGFGSRVDDGGGSVGSGNDVAPPAGGLIGSGTRIDDGGMIGSGTVMSFPDFDLVVLDLLDGGRLLLPLAR
jgi:hypothetical protein